ncbi:hypothetical protein [Streptomyces noursei]|uniref:hypothetical protein n=1 Tax=Streptomyces noursei TaxID=1971 RepID=UPI00167B969E|nr:hypothetical protein [Streptomyces noursei]MCZ1014155.1 hypothetical protein [Streptomyces noursei]GGX24014.1 hypothetical protein GCM10010341_51520 [Streptomyces noursei]
MAFEVIRDEDGTEYTERVPDSPEPASEPLCWAHHSNVCDCSGCRPRRQPEHIGGVLDGAAVPAGRTPLADE